MLLQLALLYDAVGKEERAVALYEPVLKLDGSQVAAAINLAGARWKRGNSEEPIGLWRQALAADPGPEQPRLSLAMAEMQAGEMAAAEADLRKLLEMHPEAAGARTLLKQILSRH